MIHSTVITVRRNKKAIVPFENLLEELSLGSLPMRIMAKLLRFNLIFVFQNLNVLDYFE
tara:strand:+ start:211 stop:387 length:177 start_codon:yes stop_codon:yes gene_type:complete